MGRQLCWLTSGLLVVIAIAPSLVCAFDLSNKQAGNLYDSNAATLVAVEQAANLGDPNAATIVAIERAAKYGDSKDEALACYFGPC